MVSDRLTDQEAVYIHRASWAGAKVSDLALKYKVGHSLISNIKFKRTYINATKDEPDYHLCYRDSDYRKRYSVDDLTNCYVLLDSLISLPNVRKIICESLSEQGYNADKLRLRNLCGNKFCINLDHYVVNGTLFAQSIPTELLDCPVNLKSDKTIADILTIYRALVNGKRSQGSLASEYGIASSTCSAIKLGNLYGWLTSAADL